MQVASIAFLFVALTATLAYSHTEQTPAEAKAMLDAGGDLTVLDIRERSEYCDTIYPPPGHIIGAINMPWNSGYLQEHYSVLPPDEDIIVVCLSGGRTRILLDQRYEM